MAHMDDCSCGAGFHIVERVARRVAVHGGDVDALMQCAIDDFRPHALRTAHIAIGTAFPGLRFDALEVPIHIHVEVLWPTLQEGLVFRGPIEKRGAEWSGGSK